MGFGGVLLTKPLLVVEPPAGKNINHLEVIVLRNSLTWNRFQRDNSHLVGGFNPLKNMKVSWDDYSQYMEKLKCSKPPGITWIWTTCGRCGRDENQLRCQLKSFPKHLLGPTGIQGAGSSSELQSPTGNPSLWRIEQSSLPCHHSWPSQMKDHVE